MHRSSFTVSVVVNPKPSIVDQTPAAVAAVRSVTLERQTSVGTKIIPTGTTYSWSSLVATGITGLQLRVQRSLSPAQEH
jgi:apolipoprotein N-acyltransferase